MKRVWEHKVKAVSGFTAKTASIASFGMSNIIRWSRRFARERQIKKWKRAWKTQLIEADNPQWVDG